MTNPFRQRTCGILVVAAALALQGPGAAGVPAPQAAGPVEPVAAVSTDDGLPSPVGAWHWPLGGPEGLLQGFDPPATQWGAGHRGVDLRAARGTRVRSPAPGVVAFVGTVVDRPVITVDHGDDLVSSFEPAVAGLSVGQAVARGQVVGTVGTGGHCSAVCVHWGVRRHGAYIDPLSLVMDRRPSILLPVPPGSDRP
ncbi:murein hydrolase activator EnvC [Arthrobacter sp. JSM 101049]|uniref:murein hydrolase activator EnvC family protein n=1 Tax=Arthrobacter sp. JSM 101049 TaxID=929097 RepID=UPI003569727B